MDWILLLKNRWVQYGLIAVLAVVAYFTLRQHFINEGKESGRQEEKQNTKEQVQKVQEQDRAQTVAAVSAAEAKAAAAGARADAAEAIAAQFADLNKLLISQRAQIQAQVNAVPDSELHGRITDTLGLRPKTDSTPGYYPTEERFIYSTLLEKPTWQQQADANAKEIAKHTEAINELRDQVKNQQERYDILAGYAGRVEQRYTTLYNLYPKKKRGKSCIYLWACEKKILPVPDPDELKKESPNGPTASDRK